MAAITGNLEMSGVSRVQMDELRQVLMPHLKNGAEESIRYGDEADVVTYRVSFNWAGDDAAMEGKLRLVQTLFAPAEHPAELVAVEDVPVSDMPVLAPIYIPGRQIRDEQVTDKARAFLDVPLDSLRLSARTFNALKNECDYIGELVQFTEDALLGVNNIGRKSVNELKAILDDHDLYLAGRLVGWQRPDWAERPTLNGVPITARQMYALTRIDGYRADIRKHFYGLFGWTTLANILSDAEREAKLETVTENLRDWVHRMLGYGDFALTDKLVGFTSDFKWPAA